MPFTWSNYDVERKTTGLPNHAELRKTSYLKMFCITMMSLVAIAALSSTVAYFITGLNGMRSCHCKSVQAFKLGNNQRFGNDLWAYASIWSYPRGQPQDPIMKQPSRFVPEPVLGNLQQTFRTLSLPPIDQIRKRCKNVPWHRVVDSFVIVEPELNGPFNTGIPELLDFWDAPQSPFLDGVFTADLKPEFQFREDVLEKAQKIMFESLRSMNASSFDSIVPVYLSSITPDIEKKLSGGNSSLNATRFHSEMLQETINSYRQSGKPLFLIIGNASLADNVTGSDIIKLGETPDNVSLALISSNDNAIFNHGLLPAFGALLGRTSATSIAMDKNILSAAQNASLNWTTHVTY